MEGVKTWDAIIVGASIGAVAGDRTPASMELRVLVVEKGQPGRGSWAAAHAGELWHGDTGCTPAFRRGQCPNVSRVCA